MKNPTRFVLYARKSSEREDRQIQSIDDQIAYWKKKAEEEGIEIVKIYTEEKSAKTPYLRKVFQEMCIEIEKGYIDWILCWKLDRLSRNPIDTGTIQYMLQRQKIHRVITSDRVYFPEDSWLLFSVETGMANQYILDLSKNSKRWLQSKLSKWHFPGMACQWYVNDKVNKVILRDPDRFDLVKKMWELLLTWCYTPWMIRWIATEEWGYRTLKRKKSGGKVLTLSSLYDLFRNPFYAWKMRYMWSIVQGSHEAMIKWEDYLKAQKLIWFWKGEKQNIESERPSVKTHAYTGYVVCWECGCMVTGETHTKTLQLTKERKSYTYYHCTHKRNTPSYRCKQTQNITQANFENQIQEILESLEIIPEFLEWAKVVLERRNAEVLNSRKWVYDSINNAIELAERKKGRLLQMRLNWEFDWIYWEYEKSKVEIEKEIQWLHIRKTEIEKENINWEEMTMDTFNFVKSVNEAFKNWDIIQKKLIFRSIGSNWILLDEKLNTNLHDWFFVIQKFNIFNSPLWQALELTEKGICFWRSDAFDDHIMMWWRDPDLNRGHIDFQSIALPTELSRH